MHRIAIAALLAVIVAAAAGCAPTSPDEACQGHGGVSWATNTPAWAHCNDGTTQEYL